MQFEKAYKELLKGKKIRRKEWETFMHLRFQNNEVKAYKGDYTHFYNNANILISDDWMVLDGDGKVLSFLESIEELKNKKKLTNKKWLEEKLDKFIFIADNQFTMCTAVEYEFMPTWEDLMSSDWEVMQ